MAHLPKCPAPTRGDDPLPESFPRITGGPRTIQDLPDEILFQVFALLPPHVLLKRVVLVCRGWRELLKEGAFWRSLRALSLDPHECGTGFVGWVVSRCPNLRYLAIRGSPFRGSDPIAFPRQRLPQLRSLTLCYVVESCEAGLAALLGGCPRLRTLRLVEKYKPLSPGVVEAIALLPELASLELSMLYVVEEGVLAALFDSCAPLRHLHLSAPEELEGRVVERIFRRGRGSLTSLTLLQSFPEVAFEGVAFCAKLTALTIGCGALTDSSLALLASLPALHTLGLEGGRGFTTGALRALFAGPALPGLRHLALVDLAHFEDSALEVVATRYARALETLGLEYLPRVSGRGLDFVARRCSRLVALRLGGLSLDYSRLLRHLHLRLPRLRRLLLLDRDVAPADVRRFVGRHPAFAPRPARALSDASFYALYARCLDPANPRPIVAFMDPHGHIQVITHEAH